MELHGAAGGAEGGGGEEEEEECDVVLVGCGFTALSVGAALRHKHPSLRLTFISREPLPGGVWTSAAPSVRLHQPTHWYALPTVPYADPRSHADPLHFASAAQVREYAHTVLASLGASHLAAEVIDVALAAGGRRRVAFVRLGGGRGSLVCRRVVQATGFSSYSGEPRELGLPREVHSSRLLTSGAASRGERCLVVGSGKSAVDAVRLLVRQGNEVRCVYRRTTAFVVLPFNTFYARLLSWINPPHHFAPSLNPPLSEALGLSTGWEFDYTSEPAVNYLTFVLAGDGKLKDLWKHTRGGILRRSEYLLMNWMLHAHGVRADVRDIRIEEADGAVVCDAFPNERFDRVISCSGYLGTTKLLPHAIYALEPVHDSHLPGGWLVGSIINDILDDEQAIASWNQLATRKSEFPWVGRTKHVRAWVAAHRNGVAEAAWAEYTEALTKMGRIPRTSKFLNVTTFFIDALLCAVFDGLAKLVVGFTWRCSPKWLSQMNLRVFGPWLARQ